jgi:dinuclear metal center YbgI/SA1388 family protein
MLLIANILSWLDDYAPFRYAEAWDHCGLQVGDPASVLERVLVALDPSAETIREAERLKCECLIAHHPLIHRPLDAVRADRYPGNLVTAALMKRINVIAVHTNLDSAREGTNDHLARLLSLGALEPLESNASFMREPLYGGMGRIGFLQKSVSLGEFADTIRRTFGGISLRIVGDGTKQIHRVAVCGGSGGSLTEQAIAAGADAYVTGDLKYHEAQRAVDAGLAMIDIGHFASEKIIVAPLVDYLVSRASREGVGLEVFAAKEERDPFWS